MFSPRPTRAHGNRGAGRGITPGSGANAEFGGHLPGSGRGRATSHQSTRKFLACKSRSDNPEFDPTLTHGVSAKALLSKESVMSYAKVFLSISAMILVSPLFAQAKVFPEGSSVIASPLMNPEKWEKCTVKQYKSASQMYELSCGTLQYFVSSQFVVEDSGNNEGLLINPAARDLFAAGTEVIASPTYLPDRWERCSVTKILHGTNGYEIACASGLYVVSRTQVLLATEENIRLKISTATEGSPEVSTRTTDEASLSPQIVEASDAQNDLSSAVSMAPPSAASGYFPGMLIEASPMEGIWGEAVIIEQVGDGFRVQMMPSMEFVGAPQLMLRPEQIRVAVLAKETLEPELSLPNGTYYCGISNGGMVFFTGEIELKDGFFRGPAFDGHYGEWYPMETTPEGAVVWGGPLAGFETDSARVVSTAIKSDGGNPAFDVLLQMENGRFLSNSCVPK